jgi:carbonic anhydrase
MDERIHIEQALGIGPDDAHIFRNAGGLVSDDAIRSAALTTNFFGTKEIIIVTHTDCGMLRFNGADVAAHFLNQGIDPTQLEIDPWLPELRLPSKESFIRWWKFYTDHANCSPDAAALKAESTFKNHPLIPKTVQVAAYVYEVETHRLRKPNQELYKKTSEFIQGKVFKE